MANVLSEDAARFFNAVKTGDLITVSSYLDKDPEKWKEAKDKGGLTPFLKASSYGQTRVMDLVLKSGCNINAKSKKNNGVLALAALNGKVKAVKYLHSRGFDFNVTHQYKYTALHWAAQKGKVDVADYLFSQMINVDVLDKYGQTPFLVAVVWGKIGVMELLMKNGCNINAKDSNGNGALALAALNGHVESVQILHCHEFDLNETHQLKYTALHFAAQEGRVDVADYLLSQMVNVDVQNDDGQTPFALAAAWGNIGVMDLLMKKRRNINAKSKNGEGALALAAAYGKVNAVKYLHSKGYDLNETHKLKFTALHWAALEGQVGVAYYLLSQGVKVDVQDEYGQTPFLVAAAKGKIGILELLMENGCNIIAKDKYGNGALEHATAYGYAEIVKYLQSKRFDLNTSQQQKETPLQTSAEKEDDVNEENDVRSKEEKLIYERALKSGSIQVERIRLLFVGQDGSGKTSLIRSLLSKPFDKNLPSTDGVAIDVAVTDAEKWQEQEGPDGLFLDRCLERGFHLVRTREENTPSTLVVSAEDEAIASLSGYKDTDTRLRRTEAKIGRDLPFPGQSQEEREQGEVDVSSNSSKTGEESILGLTAFLKDSEKIMASLDQYVKMEKKLAGMENLQITHLWELGGQETYLSTHYSLLPSSASRNSLTAYIAVVNLSLPLGDQARSCFHSADGSIADCTKDLGWMENNEDFLRAWLSNFSIAYSDSLELQSIQPRLGATESVANPPVFIAGTHLDCPLGKEFLEKQIQSVSDIVEEKHYEGHIVRQIDNACGHLFLIDNTKSIQCGGVTQLRQCIDQMRTAHYSNKSPQPFRWILLEFLIASLKKNNPIINERILNHLAIQRCGLIDEKEVKLALCHLEGLGVILKFPNVPCLAEEVFIDPEWVVKTLAVFVTARKPGPLLMNAWHSLQKNGVMSKELSSARLAAAKVPEEKKDITLNLLHHLNITSPVSRQGNAVTAVGQTEESGHLFIPCLLTAKSAEITLFQQIDPSGPFPPPLMVIPLNVDAVPEALFFRLVTRFLRHYEVTVNGLSRHRCLFHTAAFTVELLFADRGKAVTVTVGGNPGFLKGTWVAELKKIRVFFENQISEVKHPGMSGFEYEMRYYMGAGRKDGRSDAIRKDYVYKLFEDPRECPRKSPWLRNDEDGNQPSNPAWADRVRLWFGMESRESAAGDFVTQEPICNVSTPEKHSQRDFERCRRRIPDLRTAFQPNLPKADPADVQPTIERCINDSELNVLSAKITLSWKNIARHLSISEDDISQIKANNFDDIREQAFQMLSSWKKKFGRSASVGCLCKALLTENLREVAEIVFKLSDDILDYLSIQHH